MQISAISNHYLSWGTPNPDSKQSKITNVASRIFETAFVSSATFSLVYSSLLTLAYVTNVLNPLTPYLLAITTIAAAALYLYNLPAEHQALAIETAADVPNPKQAFKADLIVYNSGHQSWEMKKEMIRSAQQSIECSFNFAGGPFLHEFLDICSNRLMNSNVKIHLLLEDIISEKADREKMEAIQRLYPDRFFYQIARKMHSNGSLVGTEENHSKLLVVDGKYFMMGSTGVHETFCGEPIEYNRENIHKHRKTLPVARHEDSDIAGAAKDNLAFLMRDEFFRLYTVWSFRLKTPLKHNEGVYFSVDPTPTICASFDNHENVRHNQTVRFLVSGPEHRGNNPIENTYVTMISSAEKTVQIANLAFYLTSKIKKSLKNTKAVKTGYFEGIGEKTLTLSCISKIAINTQNKKDYDCLDEVYEWTDPLSLYHRKVMVIDEKHIIIGSYNLGIKSALYDYECALVIEDSPEIAKDLMSHISTGPRIKERTIKAKSKLPDVPSLIFRQLVSPIMG